MRHPHRRIGRRLTLPSMIVALGLVMPATAMVAGATDDTGGESGESLDADPALLAKALGSESTEGVPEPCWQRLHERARRSMTRCSRSLECWSNKSCETGPTARSPLPSPMDSARTWREVTHMEFVLQALTYPEIGEIIYTSAK